MEYDFLIPMFLFIAWITGAYLVIRYVLVRYYKKHEDRRKSKE